MNCTVFSHRRQPPYTDQISVCNTLVDLLEVNMLVLTHVFGDVTLRRASMGLLCFIDTLGISHSLLLKNGPRICPGASHSLSFGAALG